MTQRAELQAEQPPRLPDSPYEVPPAVRRRREAAARVRRRRMLVADVGIGVLLALLGFALAPGLAILAVAAIVVLAGCAGWLTSERLAARRRAAGRPHPLARWRARWRARPEHPRSRQLH